MLCLRVCLAYRASFNSNTNGLEFKRFIAVLVCFIRFLPRFTFFQELPQARAAAERYPHPAEELRRLLEAQELAVVEALH